MILPGKHIRPDRSLLVIGADLILLLDSPATVSELWNRVRAVKPDKRKTAILTYDWFVLALTFLHAIQAIRMEDGHLWKEHRP
jgi:hypothetical protein